LQDVMGDKAGAGIGAGMLGAMAIGAPRGSKGIKAYHGSPHNFDEFKVSQIGTGEGAQAYGHGLYFAESEDVAKGYKDTLSEGLGTVDGKPLGGWAAEILDGSNGDPIALKARIDKVPEDFWAMNFMEGAAAKEELLGVVDRLKSGESKWKPGGSMYEVNIDANPDELLDYDLPLSEQSDYVRGKLSKLGVESNLSYNKASLIDNGDGSYAVQLPHGAASQNYANIDQANDVIRRTNEMNERSAKVKEPTGNGLLRDRLRGLSDSEGMVLSPEGALKSQGIKGIRYADGNSRGTNGGTSNYVIFDERLITISKKYGIAIPAAAAMLYGEENADQGYETI